MKEKHIYHEDTKKEFLAGKVGNKYFFFLFLRALRAFVVNIPAAGSGTAPGLPAWCRRGRQKIHHEGTKDTKEEFFAGAAGNHPFLLFFFLRVLRAFVVNKPFFSLSPEAPDVAP